MRTFSALALLLACAPSEAVDITYETRALTGTDGPLGPALGAGVNFSGFATPVINAAGQTSFRGFLAGPGVTDANNNGIWFQGGGQALSLVARRGSPAPGTAAGVNFGDFTLVIHGLNGAGQTAFLGNLVGTGVDGTNDSGIWSQGGGAGLALVARRGSQAPGTAGGVNFSLLGNPVFNAAGQAAFRSDLIGTGVTATDSRGLWSQGAGAGLALLARTGSPAPGTDPGVNFSGFNLNPVLNGAGQTAFIGGLAGPGVTSANNTGVWSGGGGAGLAVVAREGNPAPGVAFGVNFGGFIDDPAFNAAGQTAFVGSLTGAGVNSDNDTAIWSAGGGSGLALVVREGSQAPGTNAGVRFSSFANLLLNGAGRTAFTGRLTGAGVNSENAVGIWTQGDGSGLTLVARSGSPAPGTPNVVRFHPFPFSRPEFNGEGQVAFTGFLVGTGITTANDVGIWATDRAGQLHLIAREGDLFDVSDDPLNPDLRTLLGVSSTAGAGFSSGGEDGRPAVINDAGQLAFFASFTDGSSGIFVATIGGDSTPPFAVTIAPAIAPASGFNFAWNSQPGKVYDLVTSTDLATPVTQWPVHASYGDIPATGTTTTLTAVPADGPQRFFAVVEK